MPIKFKYIKNKTVLNDYENSEIKKVSKKHAGAYGYIGFMHRSNNIIGESNFMVFRTGIFKTLTFMQNNIIFIILITLQKYMQPTCQTFKIDVIGLHSLRLK